MLKYYGGFNAGEKPKADFPQLQHHCSKVCSDPLKVAALGSLFIHIKDIRTLRLVQARMNPSEHYFGNNVFCIGLSEIVHAANAQ